MSREVVEKSEKDAPRSAGVHDSTLFTRAAAELLRGLPDRNRSMVDARFGVATGEAKTLAEIGEKEHISRERVRQIVEAGLAVLRRAAPGNEAVVRAHAVVRTGARTSGGVAIESEVLRAVGAPTSSVGALRLLLTCMPELTEARETQRTAKHWILTVREQTSEGATLEGVLEVAERLLTEEKRVIPETEFLAKLKTAIPEPLSDAAALTYLAVSQRIVRTPLGAYGLRSWREAVPRSVGDKAAVVLREGGKPMHFRDVAQAINRIGFDRKQALPETVHNDLIRDERFVLVGRGLYALRDWGYAPGRVADVVERVLHAAGRPLARAEVIAAVLKERFVKRNTILLSLLNHERIETLPNGKFALKGLPGSPRPNADSPVS